MTINRLREFYNVAVNVHLGESECDLTLGAPS